MKKQSLFIALLLGLFHNTFAGKIYVLSNQYETTFDYECMKKLPQSIVKFFPDIPQNGVIQWNQILGCDEAVGEDEIRQKYKKLAPKIHPDKNTEDDTTEIFQAIAAAQDEGIASTDFKIMYKKSYDLSSYGPKSPVFYGEPTEIVSVSLPDILKKEEKDVFVQSEKLFSDWKCFYIQKACLLAFMAFGYRLCKHIADPNTDSRLKKNTFVQKIVARYAAIKKKYGKERVKYIKRGARVAFFAIFGLYPLYRFRKLRQLASLTDDYRSEDLNFNNLQWFYR